ARGAAAAKARQLLRPRGLLIVADVQGAVGRHSDKDARRRPAAAPEQGAAPERVDVAHFYALEGLDASRENFTIVDVDVMRKCFFVLQREYFNSSAQAELAQLRLSQEVGES
ncbi:unnamed protein product, partial [Polarella glacialis]